MNRLVWFFLVAFLPSTCYLQAKIYDLKKHGYEQYQDIYVNGKVQKKASYHERYKEKRFQIVDSVLSKYKRPFTMLDVGAAQGYFTFRAAEKYPQSVFVMLEGSNSVYPKISRQVQSICKANNTVDNVIWLDKPIVLQDFQRLAKCEHFDVVLAQNILHWFPSNWKLLLDSFLKMSHVTIIELPPVESSLDAANARSRTAIHAYLQEHATEVIEGVPRHTNPSLKTIYYLFVNQKEQALLEQNSLIHPESKEREHCILFNFEQKNLCKKDLKAPYNKIVLPWEPGINLVTYLCLNGQYPNRNDLAEALVMDPEHRDWMPNNMVLQGKKMILIDKGDPLNEPGGVGENFCTESSLKKCKEVILKGNEASLRNFVYHQSK